MNTILNLSECAKRVGISRVTIGRHIKSGKVSVVRDTRGKKGIQVSELIRVYGELKHEVDSDVTKNGTSHDDAEIHKRCDMIIQELKHRIRMLEENEDYLKRMLEQSLFRIEDKTGKSKKKKDKKSKKRGKK